MKTAFVLIMWWSGSLINGAAIDHVEFGSKEACEKARTEIPFSSVCVAKDSPVNSGN